MFHCRETAIKLFGTTISLQLSKGLSAQSASDGSECCGEDEKDHQTNDTFCEVKDEDVQSDSQEHSEPHKSDDSKPDSCVTDNAKAINSISETHPESTINSKFKVLKKPDKILPCPRCHSMETKFCYYNNYNVNQPRHFCKKCQRYWTAGGTMRNVPVGAGRRKNKNSVSRYRELANSDTNKDFGVCTNIAESIPYCVKPNGTIFRVSSATPLEESMVPFSNHSNKRFYPSCSSSENQHTEDSRKSDAQASAIKACGSGAPWPHVSVLSSSSVFSGPSFAVPLYPAAAYWTSTGPLSTWSLPTITDDNSSMERGVNHTMLGKHSRDGNSVDQETSCISVPKTMTIDDPQEAAKSSIWAIINRENSKNGSSKGKGFFRAFEPKAVIKKHPVEAQMVHANPAALARSANFLESS